jgi:predicted RNase H-like HicB family nuclease
MTAYKAKGKRTMTCTFQIVIEANDDRWSAYCPALLAYGALTCGETRDDALQRLQNLVTCIIDALGVPAVLEHATDFRIAYEVFEAEVCATL